MSGRPAAWATLALAGGGLLLLATTQPWVATVTEVAAGAPRSREAVRGAELVPWLAPVALAAGAAVVAGLSGMRWARPVAGVAVLAVLGGTALAVGGALSGDPAGARVVSAAPTGWLWVAAAAAGATTLGTLLWWRPWSRRRAAARPAPAGGARPPDGGPPDDAAPGVLPDDPDGAEAGRRRDAAHWRDLSEGRDPTER